MLALENRMNQFLMKYAQTMLEGIPDERMTEQPLPGVNHPAWIVGHLAIAADGAVKLLGGATTLGAEWSKPYGRGSVAVGARSEYPSKEALVSALEQCYARARELAAAAGDDVLRGPNPNSLLKEGLPTVGDLVGFLLTGHLAIHLGQLSMWRRMIGLAPMF